MTGTTPKKVCTACTKATNANTAACTVCPATYWYTADACTLVNDATTTTYCKTWAIGGCTDCTKTGSTVNGGTFTVLKAGTASAAGTCIPCTDATLTATLGDKCSYCTTTACKSCASGATLVSGKCAVDANCKVASSSACLSCKLGYKLDSNGSCTATCDATKGCTVVAGGNCDLTVVPGGAGNGGAGGAATTSSSAVLAFAFSALLLVLAVLF